MQLKPRFWGSTTALALGVLAVLAGVGRPSSTLFLGLVLILAAVAYRSAKRAKLGIVASSNTRSVAEALAIIAACALVTLQRNFLAQAYADPVPNLLVPLWAVIAYCTVKFAGSPSRAAHH